MAHGCHTYIYICIYHYIPTHRHLYRYRSARHRRTRRRAAGPARGPIVTGRSRARPYIRQLTATRPPAASKRPCGRLTVTGRSRAPSSQRRAGRARGGDQLAGALGGGKQAGRGSRARLARAHWAGAVGQDQPGARAPDGPSDQVPLRPKQRANLRGPLCMGARVDARTTPYKMGPPPTGSGPGNVCTHDDRPVEVGGSMWKARAASPLVACELCAGHFFPARQAASL